jgi:hypothetical protein
MLLKGMYVWEPFISTQTHSVRTQNSDLRGRVRQGVRALRVGFGRIVVSDTEVPNLLANLV